MASCDRDSDLGDCLVALTERLSDGDEPRTGLMLLRGFLKWERNVFRPHAEIVRSHIECERDTPERIMRLEAALLGDGNGNRGVHQTAQRIDTWLDHLCRWWKPVAALLLVFFIGVGTAMVAALAIAAKVAGWW